MAFSNMLEIYFHQFYFSKQESQSKSLSCRTWRLVRREFIGVGRRGRDSWPSQRSELGPAVRILANTETRQISQGKLKFFFSKSQEKFLNNSGWLWLRNCCNYIDTTMWCNLFLSVHFREAIKQQQSSRFAPWETLTLLKRRANWQYATWEA